MSNDATLPSKPAQPPSQSPSQTRSPQGPTADADGRPKGGISWFPLGYREAVQQWWTSVSARQAERNVLSFIPHLREADADSSPLQEMAKSDPFGQRVWRQSLVKLSGKDRALNEVSVERVGEKADDTLVMLHGYGAGLGFFYKNFEPLSRVPGWKLYALDMLGMGNSSRPTFKIHAKTPQEKITEAENWFIDALEEWRRIRNIEKFTLMGHSLGGYLAVSYALKYPGRLNKLILASPAGIPEDPYAVNADMPEPEESTMGNEFTQDQESIVNGKSDGGNINFVRATDKKAAAKANTTTPARRPIPGWVVWLWDANVSPFSIVRLAGPLGPRFVSGWTARRFNHLPSEEKQALHTYSYSLFRQKGSGEYVLPYLLAPGAHARSPLIRRIQEVGRQIITPATETTPAVRETGFPIVLMYGENDWMDVAGGFAAEEKIKQRIVQALIQGTPEEKRRESGSAKVLVVKKAGHHLYLDNPEEFNAFIQKELEETRKQGLKRKETS
ncbi:Alpha/Beta hydrolase protein [Lasiosphaeria miniovina]|uniref:Alpha/Beta hydrolase protein n=1 Tax=Lasiosphaeria miniovina TaxID=1954250 RepID=A0AA39ZQQ8_9PEZI|nr:Alpha/Beta hydrolase protein [Lasiosphaeria miniovina]KAK0701833.1 Alpha/Beta hydrolase protein [Lasiosphaeria miniovina]